MLNNSNEADDVKDVPVPTIADVEQWLSKDLGTCVSLLSAIHNDADLRRQMAVFLQGRIVNFKNKPDPKQVPLFNKQPA